jgi:hypothetical protein
MLSVGERSDRAGDQLHARSGQSAGWNRTSPVAVTLSADDGGGSGVIGPRDGKAVDLGSVGVRFMAWSEETGGGFSLVEHPIPPLTLVAPLHRHSREDEYSFVLEGRVGSLLGEGRPRLPCALVLLGRHASALVMEHLGAVIGWKRCSPAIRIPCGAASTKSSKPRSAGSRWNQVLLVASRPHVAR